MRPPHVNGAVSACIGNVAVNFAPAGGVTDLEAQVSEHFSGIGMVVCGVWCCMLGNLSGLHVRVEPPT